MGRTESRDSLGPLLLDKNAVNLSAQHNPGTDSRYRPVIIDHTFAVAMRKSNTHKNALAIRYRYTVKQAHPAPTHTDITPEHKMNRMITPEPEVQMKIAVTVKIHYIGIVVTLRRLWKFFFFFGYPDSEFKRQKQVPLSIIRCEIDQIPASR
jgi:hypothetical protein